jgi:hypothetical protein
MTFLEQIYKDAKINNIVNSSEDFSERFMNKSPSYYRTLKAQRRDANTEMLLCMLGNITTQRTQHQAIGNKHTFIIEWIDRWKDIEEKIADEVAIRTSGNRALSTDGLKSVIKALQRQEQSRAVALVH